LIDGNKRVAFVASMLFMALNGWKVAASQDMLYATFRDLAAGTISEKQLLLWFHSVSEKV
jgi:death on curing protein